MAEHDRMSLAAARRRALAPRRACFAVLGLLALLGAKGLVRGVPDRDPARAAAAAVAPPTSAGGFAEAFARAYLSWDAGAPERRVRALRPFLGRDVDADAGLPVPVSGAQRVAWTAALEQIRVGTRRVVVTVAVAVDGDSRLRHLAVPLALDARGAFAVVDYPALVGRPRRAPALQSADGDLLRDDALAEVLQRFLANYLAGAQANLRADLDSRAEPLAAPDERLALEDVLALRWAGSGRVAATVIARGSDDVAYTLRYELAVARRDRWYVRGINTPIDSRKESR